RQTRIPDVDTTNLAFYVEAKSLASQGLGWEAGARVERTSIKPNRALADATGYSMQAQAVKNFIRALPDRDFTNLTGNLLLRYRLGQGSAWVGVGHGVRVPDAKEYGFINYMNNNWMLKGNPYLNETKNNEIDLGVEHQTEQWGVKVTAFYSDLTDYIYAYKSGMTTTFANIDAHIYGGEVAANLVMFDGRVNLEGSLAYQRGKKDSQPIASQNDEDLAEMTPLRGRVALTYDDSTLYGRIEWLGATSQEDIDEANGEKKIAGYGIINLKAGYTIGKHWALNGGINNLLDQTYALNNSYVGRGVISASGNNVLVLNEPGRALYANLTYRY
ncbi:MAG: TonB-dependent receptor, partial [Campylobacterales bacterium]